MNACQYKPHHANGVQKSNNKKRIKCKRIFYKWVLDETKTKSALGTARQCNFDLDVRWRTSKVEQYQCGGKSIKKCADGSDGHNMFYMEGKPLQTVSYYHKDMKINDEFLLILFFIGMGFPFFNWQIWVKLK